MRINCWDRQTSRMAGVTDTIINQHGRNVTCIYVAIGQRTSFAAQVVVTLQEMRVMGYTIMAFKMVDSSVMLQYLATYTSVALIEYFMNFECTHFNHL